MALCEPFEWRYIRSSDESERALDSSFQRREWHDRKINELHVMLVLLRKLLDCYTFPDNLMVNCCILSYWHWQRAQNARERFHVENGTVPYYLFKRQPHIQFILRMYVPFFFYSNLGQRPFHYRLYTGRCYRIPARESSRPFFPKFQSSSIRRRYV